MQVTICDVATSVVMGVIEKQSDMFIEWGIILFDFFYSLFNSGGNNFLDVFKFLLLRSCDSWNIYICHIRAVMM